MIRNKFYIERFKTHIDSKQIILKSIQINITNKCPCKCIMCHKYTYPQIEIPSNKFNILLSELERQNVETVVLSGGEPLLYRELDIIKGYPKLKYGLLTTGIGLQKNFELFNEFEWVRVSIDGFEKTHNYIRGADIFKRVITNIEMIPRHKLRINFTIQKDNFMEFFDFINFCKNQQFPIFGYFVHSFNELSLRDKEQFLQLLMSIEIDDFIRNKTNVIELIYQLLTVPFQSKKCILPFLHCIIDADLSIWPCCYLMSDNLPYKNHDISKSYGFYQEDKLFEIIKTKLDDKVLYKQYKECKTCDSIYSRYQRINEEYELLCNQTKVFL